MLKSFAGSDVATQFHQAYYLQLLREVLAVMTDTFHTPGFKLHCRVLLHLFGIVRGETVIKAPLWDVAVGCAGPFAQSPLGSTAAVAVLFCCRRQQQSCCSRQGGGCWPELRLLLSA